MASKRQMTAAKLNRERDVKERRARKLARRAERKAEAAERAANPDAFPPIDAEPGLDDAEADTTTPADAA